MRPPAAFWATPLPNDTVFAVVSPSHALTPRPELALVVLEGRLELRPVRLEWRCSLPGPLHLSDERRDENLASIIFEYCRSGLIDNRDNDADAIGRRIDRR
jgi:hypothetical protein